MTNQQTAKDAGYQSRFIAYARSQGRTPDAQLEADDLAYPGGRMAGFIVWISERWGQWRVETCWRGSILTTSDHEAFDEWLVKSAEESER